MAMAMICDGTKQAQRVHNNALLQVADIHRLGSPKPYDLDILLNWTERPDLGGDFIQGLEARTWNAHTEDLVAVSTRGVESDFLTTSLAEKVFPWLFNRFGLGGKSNPAGMAELGVVGPKDTRFNLAANLISMSISSLMPVACIFVLFFARPLLVRLGLIMVFTVAFAITVTLVTEARRVDVFAACAAFAAVQVVFVGSSDIKA